MYIEELLEVAIGLVFVWLGLALACMGVQEWIAALFKLRARDLETAIRRMLEEPPEKTHVFRRFWTWVEDIFGGLWTWVKLSFVGVEEEDNTLVGKLYDHQLIRALSKRRRKPSYIPDRTFALALFDVVMTAGTDDSAFKGALNTWSKKLEEDFPEVTAQALVAGKEALDDLKKLVDDAWGTPGFLATWKARVEQHKAQLATRYPPLGPALDELLQTTTLQQLIQAAAAWAESSPRAAQALHGLIAGAGTYAKEGETALAAARTNVETWFNDTMDRLTGWYKRRAQVIAIILGVAFAIVLNVDAVVIATTLWREPTIRQALVVRAEKYELPDETEEGDPSTAIEEFSAEFEGLRLPMGWMAATLTSKQKCTWPWSPAGKTDETVSGAPIFWECWVPLDAPEGGIPRDWGYGLSKILGWLISGLAASQGAPFWFDVLKKLTNVRFAGKNPAEEDLKKKG